MQLPVAPLALLLALVPTLALLVLALWRANTRGLTAFQTAAFALGLALAALVLAVSATYAFPRLRPLQTSNSLLLIPALVYLVTVVAVGIRLEYGSLGIWAVVGLAPLWFLGLYAWLFAACSFGDCL